MAKAKKQNDVNEDIKALQEIKSSVCSGIFYSANMEDAMDSLTNALSGDNEKNYINTARAYDFLTLFMRAKMEDIDSRLTQFTAKVIELAKKKGWHKEMKPTNDTSSANNQPSTPVPAPAPVAANTEATKEATKATAKKKK